MYGWNERPTKASVKHFIGGDKPATVYSIGKYEVTVPGEEVEVTYGVPYHRNTDPRSTLPNMEISDGEIRIPVTDLVDEVLSRLDPVELARSLWQNDEVKDEFLYCLATRWSEQGIDDGDRRKFLTQIQEAVHSKAVDALASSAASLEWKFSKEAHHYDEVRRINDTLRELDVKVMRSSLVDGEWVQTPTLLQFDERDRSIKDETGKFLRGELEVSGRCWEEARAYWRIEVARAFPAPVEPVASVNAPAAE